MPPYFPADVIVQRWIRRCCQPLAHEEEEVARCVVRMRLVIVVWLPTHPTTHQFIMPFVQQFLRLVTGRNCSLAICREELIRVSLSVFTSASVSSYNSYRSNLKKYYLCSQSVLQCSVVILSTRGTVVSEKTLPSWKS